MSAFSTETQIANLALAEIGAARISALDSDTTAEAVACRQHFDHCRNVLLRLHPWNFAEKTAALSASSTAPVASAEWDTAWQLPGDLIRLIRVVGVSADIPKTRFDKHGEFLHTKNEDTLTIVYVTNDVPVPQWDDLFVDAMRYKLAAAIAEDLTQSPAKAEAALQKFKAMALPDAARIDAQEDASGENRSPMIQASQSGLVQSRYARGSTNYTISN